MFKEVDFYNPSRPEESRDVQIRDGQGEETGHLHWHYRRTVEWPAKAKIVVAPPSFKDYILKHWFIVSQATPFP